MRKMMKSIRLLLLGSLIQIAFSACLLWSGTSLALKQSCIYFLIFLLLLAGVCAGINYLYTRHQESHSILNSEKTVAMFYSVLLFINLLGVCLVLSETILTKNLFQQEMVELFLPSFFFLFGIDLIVFLPVRKFITDSKSNFGKKQFVLLAALLALMFLRNPTTLFSVLFYVSLGSLFLSLLFPKTMRKEVSFYGHLIRDILFVLCILHFF